VADLHIAANITRLPPRLLVRRKFDDLVRPTAIGKYGLRFSLHLPARPAKPQQKKQG